MRLFDSSEVSRVLARTPAADIAAGIVADAEQLWGTRRHGDRQSWQEALQSLPAIPAQAVQLDADVIGASADTPPTEAQLAQIRCSLMALHPWRKGPFELFGLTIDAEWRSWMKWNRLAPHLSPLDGRVVLDVGCGNGYYLFRMLGAGARVAVGIDPTQLFLAQFRAVNQYLRVDRACILPFRCEELSNRPRPVTGFDTVFSMGIYYHRRDPAAHLRELRGFLRPGGELLLETLVTEDDVDELAVEGRYARMRNVWSIPSVSRLVDQLLEQGFANPRLVDMSPTTIDEQRSTAWMTFESLDRCLDPRDPTLTVEGYPAPLRAGIIATRPE